MTNAQLFFSIGIPFTLNGALLALLVVYLNGRLTSMQERTDNRFTSMQEHMDTHFAAINQRFDDMRDLWRAALRRVEEVLDARLRHLGEQR